jgi:hypothetical protein
MNEQQAKMVLIAAVTVAQGKGAFSLNEAKMIVDAVEILTPASPDKQLPAPLPPVTEQKYERPQEDIPPTQG